MTALEPFDNGMGTTSASVWSVGARNPSESRTVQNWPLPDIPLDIPLYPSDFADQSPYPPDRARARQSLLNSLRNVYRGNYSDFVEEQPPVNVNHFARVGEIVSAVMVSEGAPRDLVDQIQQMIVSLLVYGRGFFVRLGDALFVPLPLNCWKSSESDEVLHVVSQYVSPNSPDGLYDRALVYTIAPDGAVVANAELKDGKFGAFSSTDVLDGAWGYVDRPPVEEDWGSSAFTNLIPVVIEMANRLSGISYVLGKHEAPILAVPAAEADVRNLALDGGATDLSGLGKPYVVETVNRIVDNPVLWIPDSTAQPEYLQWTGSMEPSFRMLEALQRQLRMLTGVPAALEMESGDVPSGAALRQMAAVLSWTAGALHPRVLEVLETVLGRTVDWPNPFEAAVEEEVSNNELAEMRESAE